MNEPKKRGRPAKAKACPECGQAVGHYDDCPVGLGLPRTPGQAESYERAKTFVLNGINAVSMPEHLRAAQAYADRVWEGQSVSAPREWRIERVRLALEGQNLPFEGVVLP